jgi:hypothetical protein
MITNALVYNCIILYRISQQRRGIHNIRKTANAVYIFDKSPITRAGLFIWGYQTLVTTLLHSVYPLYNKFFL